MSYSPNGDIELLIEQITDAIVARLNGEGADQAAHVWLHFGVFQSLPGAHASSGRRRRGAHWIGFRRDRIR